ncbi:hypothetical protein BDN70DRAFT_919686 [Pholiota conissans]|uniref:Uncharacterized protein n=1 Tax=Pholiota conissans TaxID=109636 RepID=A0A9P5Z7M2_9AGAR|nr:hypothetical protein BDN70DRAFT_919686 [Pholiota conissans]
MMDASTKTPTKKIGPRKPCPCARCGGALKSLSTVSNHRRRDREVAEAVARARAKEAGETKPVVKSEVLEQTLSELGQSGEPRKPDPQASQKSAALGGSISSASRETKTTTENTKTVSLAEYNSLLTAYTAMQRHCFSLEEQLYVERSIKSQIVENLDHALEILTPPSKFC